MSKNEIIKLTSRAKKTTKEVWEEYKATENPIMDYAEFRKKYNNREIKLEDRVINDRICPNCGNRKSAYCFYNNQIDTFDIVCKTCKANRGR